METTPGAWAYATRAVSVTTPAPDKLPPRTRQAMPSPRTSHLQSVIRTTPFVVPIGPTRLPGTHEKGRRYPQNAPTSSVACTGFFLMRNHVLPPLCPPHTPQGGGSPYENTAFQLVGIRRTMSL